MAIRSDISAENLWFIGEDKQLRFELLDQDDNPVNALTWDLRWVMRRRAEDPDPAVIEKTTAVGGGITLTGAFNASRALNQQRVLVTFADTDTASLRAAPYQYALKRTD